MGKIINKMKLEVCSECQLSCKNCSHRGMIEEFDSYHLSMADLKNFIHFTEISNYIINGIAIHGPGEPLLWNNLNNGLKLLFNSNTFSHISIRTNGLALRRLNDQSLERVDRLVVSDYPGIDIDFDYYARNYPNTFTLLDKSQFRESINECYSGTVPCDCWCPGPALAKDKIYVCGPPGFKAKQRGGFDFKKEKHFLKVGKNYMDDFPFSNIGTMDICECCWANDNIQDLLGDVNWELKYD